MEPKVLQLKHPFTFAGTRYEQITIQPMKAGTLRGTPKDISGEDKTLLLISKLAGMPPGAVDEMSLADYTAAGEAIMGFQ